MHAKIIRSTCVGVKNCSVRTGEAKITPENIFQAQSCIKWYETRPSTWQLLVSSEQCLGSRRTGGCSAVQCTGKMMTKSTISILNILKGVLSIPSFMVNLLFTRQQNMLSKGLQQESGFCNISKESQLIVQGDLQHGLYE
jgi:hypothetical protein